MSLEQRKTSVTEVSPALRKILRLGENSEQIKVVGEVSEAALKQVTSEYERELRENGRHYRQALEEKLYPKYFEREKQQKQRKDAAINTNEIGDAKVLIETEIRLRTIIDAVTHDEFVQEVRRRLQYKLIQATEISEDRISVELLSGNGGYKIRRAVAKIEGNKDEIAKVIETGLLAKVNIDNQQ